MPYKNGFREENSNWKGDDATVWAGYLRARTLYQKRLCSVCGLVAEIHHKDGDTLNNEPDNIDWLCRKHHMEADGRMQSRNHKGQFIRCKRCGGKILNDYGELTCINCGAPYSEEGELIEAVVAVARGKGTHYGPRTPTKRKVR